MVLGGFDSCATKHICKDMSLFKTFEIVEDGCVLFMRNSSTTVVKSKGTVNFKFTFGKVLFLTIVYFVPEIRTNLVLKVFIINLDLSLSLSQINLWAKGCAFVGKSYLFEGMFKLNLTNKVNNSAYLVDSISL
jgi:hypothetical protein